MVEFDYVVLGCGVAGLCSTKRLLDEGKRNILVLDEYAEPGGNQLSRDINGFTFDIGSFYYWPTMPMFQMFPAMLEECPRIAINIERVRPSGQIGVYPFSFRDEFLVHGPVYWAKALSSMALGRMRSRRFVTAEDFAIYWMGKRLYVDLGMANYIERFFGVPASLLEAQFAVKRLQALTRAGKMSFWLDSAYQRFKPAFMPKRQKPPEVIIVRPERGLTYMYGKALSALQASNVAFQLGEKIESIRKRGNHFEICTSRDTIRTKHLVNSMPVNYICSHLDVSPDSQVDSVSLTTLFVSFKGDLGFDGCILYNWGPRGRWKRLTMHSKYYGQRAGRHYASVEVPIFRALAAPVNELLSDFIDSARSYGLFRGDLRLEGHSNLDNAYPAYTLGTSAKVAAAIAALDALSVQSVGRQGRFDYLPTGEQVAKQVRENLKL